MKVFTKMKTMKDHGDNDDKYWEGNEDKKSYNSSFLLFGDLFVSK